MNLKFNAVEDDHFLHNTFATLDWDRLLSLQDLSTVRVIAQTARVTPFLYSQNRV
jgi:hypothetical protein